MSQTRITGPSSYECKGRIIKNGSYYKTAQSQSRNFRTDKKRLSPRKERRVPLLKDRNISDCDLKKKIITFLTEKEPQKTLTIARACNCATCKDINPTLYNLLKQGTVEKCDQSPPTWRLLPSVSLQKTLFSNHNKNSIDVVRPKNSAGQINSSSKCVAVKVTTVQLHSGKESDNMSSDLAEALSQNMTDMFRNTRRDKTAPGAYVHKGNVQPASYVENESHSNVEKHSTFNSQERGKKFGSQRHHGNGVVQNTVPEIPENPEDGILVELRNSCTNDSGPQKLPPSVGFDPYQSLTASDSLTGNVTSEEMSSPILESMDRLLSLENDSLPVNTTESKADGNDLESSDEDSDDSDDEEDIQMRIRDMIFTNSVIDPLSFNEYVGVNDDMDDDSDDSAVEEMWESGLTPGPSLSMSHMTDDITYKILSILISVPFGIISRMTLLSMLNINEDSLHSCLELCENSEFITQIRSDVKITDTGKVYLNSKSSLVTNEQLTYLPFTNNDYTSDYYSTEKLDANDIPFDYKSHLIKNPPTVMQRLNLPMGRGFNHSSSGPAPSPAMLLQESSLFRHTNHCSNSGGRGRGILGQSNWPMSRGSKADENSPSGTEILKLLTNHIQPLESSSPSSERKPLESSSPSLERKPEEKLIGLMPWATYPHKLQLSNSSEIPQNERAHHLTQHSASSSASSSPSSLPSSSTALDTAKPIYESSSSSMCTPPMKFDSPQKSPNDDFSPDQQVSTSNTRFTERRPPLLETPVFAPVHSSFNSTPTVHAQSMSGAKIPLLPYPLPLDLPVQTQRGVTNTTSHLQINSESFAVLNKNPISALMEYAQSRKLTAQIEVLSQRGPPHKPVFMVAAFLGSRRFPGITCHNKKDGRKDAAEQAIRTLIAEGEYHMNEETSVLKLPESDMTHFDKMAALTHQKFNQLIAQIPESFTGRKVIAGLVIKVSSEDVGSVIAIGSGNRCITGDKLSLEGHTVNDCHAEIITRRGFLRFLYHQLSMYREHVDHPIFEKSRSGKLRVKDCVSFHLYISTAPCGDGALFSPRDVASNTATLSDSDDIHKPTFSTPVQGVLRTKMEGGEGTIPINPADTVQTWDGIVRGERLRTMSCSDKICRWNVLGIQGALLSHFLDTIYLRSLTLGFLYDHGHLSRAVCCRLNRGSTSFKDELPYGFHLNHPALGRVTACDPPRETQKTKSYSVNWSACEEKPELLDGSLGHCHTGIEKNIFSRLTKNSLYTSFKSTCHCLGRQDLVNVSSYHEAKQRSSYFTSAKQVLMKQFIKSRCGKWVSKPMEEEMFS